MNEEDHLKFQIQVLKEFEQLNKRMTWHFIMQGVWFLILCVSIGLHK